MASRSAISREVCVGGGTGRCGNDRWTWLGCGFVCIGPVGLNVSKGWMQLHRCSVSMYLFVSLSRWYSWYLQPRRPVQAFHATLEYCGRMHER